MQLYDDVEDEELGPSRSQQRRDALAVLDMAEKLVALRPSDLAKVPLSDDLLACVHDTIKIKSHIAHKRQMHYLAKQLRREDDDVLDAIRAALAIPEQTKRAATQHLHKLERWRERLLSEGDTALSEFIQHFPKADRQRLRQLIRNTLDEQKRNKPPAAFRELLGLIREAFESASDGMMASGELSGDERGEGDEQT